MVMMMGWGPVADGCVPFVYSVRMVSGIGERVICVFHVRVRRVEKIRRIRRCIFCAFVRARACAFK